MSKWTHAACADCYEQTTGRQPESATALKPEYRVIETCCWCGHETRSGIYLRHNPNALRCKGEHPGDN